MTPEITHFILQLHAIGAVQFGSFSLKGNIPSPIYIDLRLTISHPLLMKQLSAALNALSKPLMFDLLCGIPYAALPIATALSLEGDHPMILCRKEAKDYGTKKLIEGKFRQGQTCLLIEDVAAFGTSIAETALNLRSQGLKVTDALVIVNREQGAKENLAENDITLHSLISLFDILKVLLQEQKIDAETFEQVHAYASKALS